MFEHNARVRAHASFCRIHCKKARKQNRKKKTEKRDTASATTRGQHSRAFMNLSCARTTGSYVACASAKMSNAAARAYVRTSGRTGGRRP